MMLSDAVKQVARVIGKRVFAFHLPVFVHQVLAGLFERTMTAPLISTAQVRMLEEGMVDALPACGQLPEDLVPKTVFSEGQIRKGLPEAEPFGVKDLRSRIVK